MVSRGACPRCGCTQFTTTVTKKYDFDIMRKGKKLLCVDFDGVLHLSSKGFYDGSVYDGPTPGAREFIDEAMNHFDIIIYTARARTARGRQDVKDFLKKHGFPELPVECRKPPAYLTIDDRAITFTGTFPSPEDIKKFKHWNGITWGDIT